jgi:hypothetical protein
MAIGRPAVSVLSVENIQRDAQGGATRQPHARTVTGIAIYIHQTLQHCNDPLCANGVAEGEGT